MQACGFFLVAIKNPGSALQSSNEQHHKRKAAAESGIYLLRDLFYIFIFYIFYL